MPIKGLTTQREPAFPRIGVLRKGGVKSEKRPGADLKHFRFDTDSPQALKNFEAAYGKQPDTINVYLPYSTPDENFQAWQEEYKSGGLVHRCDGETMSVWLTPDGKYSTDPKPCPYHTGQAKRTTNEPGCKPVGRLTVIIPELQRFAYVTVGTTSKNDIMELTDNLNAVFAMRGNLQGIPFVLCRRPKMISTPTPDGGRARYEKWMLSLEVNPQWATMQLETMRKQAMLPSGVKLLTSGHAIQEDTGEIIEGVWEDDDTDDDNPFSDAPPATNGNGNGAKAAKLPAAMLKRLHAVGNEAYGKEWDTKRPELVKSVTKGRSESSSDLTPDEASTLISGMEKRIAKLAAESQAVPA